MKTVLVCSGCCNGTPETGWITSNINLFLIVLEELETKITVPADLGPCEGPLPGL